VRLSALASVAAILDINEGEEGHDTIALESRCKHDERMARRRYAKSARTEDERCANDTMTTM